MPLDACVLIRPLTSPPLPQRDRTHSPPSISGSCMRSCGEWQGEPNLPPPIMGEYWRLPETPEWSGRVSWPAHSAALYIYLQLCATHNGAYFRLQQLTAAGALGRLIPVDKKHHHGQMTFQVEKERRSWDKAALPTSVLELRSIGSTPPV
jgi:hypothetical protein